jgi:NADH-quinone oxidoreductase subunit G
MKVKVNDVELDLKPGTSAIDAVFAAGHDVPYFCSQEYMSPIGACRMCLAKVGAPRKDKDGEWIKDEETGEVKIFYFPNMMATCTTAIMEGMVIDTLSREVKDAQAGMIEFTLINHPLDCPVCDKGGACELQDRSYEYGTGESRFVFDKRHQQKYHALSEVITLDRERCIHCKRCVRYFEEIPGDEVLDFIERGGHTYIGSLEDGLPSNFTGNITDICPVGALLDTTSRFRGRNWEYHHTRSTCLDCPVGCADVIDSRTGRIERIKAGRNTQVNLDWLCDGGRFGHEYADAPDRLKTPLLRKDGQLTPVTWEEAARFIGDRLRGRGKEVGIVLRSDSTLEEGIAAQSLAELLGTGQLDHSPRPAAPVIPSGNQATLSDLATADAILVIGDITEEAPIVDIRIKDALKGVPPPDLLPHGVPIADLRLKERMPRKRGILAVAAPYRADLMKHAGALVVYPAGGEAALLSQLVAAANGEEVAEAETGMTSEAAQALAKRLKEGEKAVIIYGAFVLASPEAADKVAALAKATGARLMAVGPMANSYGLQAVGVLPSHARYAYRDMLAGSVKGLILCGLDPAQDEAVREKLKDLELLVVHDSFLGETARLAHVVLPAKTGYEKEGTTVNLEGRYLKVAPAPLDVGTSEDFTGVVKYLGEAIGQRMEGRSARSAHRKLKKALGVELAELPAEGEFMKLKPKQPPKAGKVVTQEGNLLLVPTMVRPERLGRNPHLRSVFGDAPLRLHPEDAKAHGLVSGQGVRLNVAGFSRLAAVHVTDTVPRGLMLLPALPEQPAGLYSVDLERDLSLAELEPLPQLSQPVPGPRSRNRVEDLPETRLLGASD